jgi:hypothetical protein
VEGGWGSLGLFLTVLGWRCGLFMVFFGVCFASSVGLSVFWCGRYLTFLVAESENRVTTNPLNVFTDYK